MDEREGERSNRSGWRSSNRSTAFGGARPSSPVRRCVRRTSPTEHIQELKREAVKNNLKFW